MKLKKRSDVIDIPAEEGNREEKSRKNSRKMELNVILYTIILFVAALGLILLSYAIQQRSEAALPEDVVLSGTLDGETPGDYNLFIENNLT